MHRLHQASSEASFTGFHHYKQGRIKVKVKLLKLVNSAALLQNLDYHTCPKNAILEDVNPGVLWLKDF